MMDAQDGIDLENGGEKEIFVLTRSVSTSVLRTKSDPALVSHIQGSVFRHVLGNLHEVILGTKLAVLFPAIPLAIVANSYQFGRPWIFALSLLGLAPLAERVSFLTEQIACYTGPTVGGLLNATCGNATELIIALLALRQKKILVLKYSLLGSILSNLLLVLGTSLFCGGIANLNKEQLFDRKQADVNALLLLLGLLCNTVPLLFKGAFQNDITLSPETTLELSRVGSIVMLMAYGTYIFFQLKAHGHSSVPEETTFWKALDTEDPCFLVQDSRQATVDIWDDEDEEKAVLGFWSSFTWLVGMTLIIALLSEYVVGTIEAASNSWGVPVSFISIILLPIVGNAAEHAGSIIFAWKNKLDISLGVALGSATQISMFVVPLCIIVAWILGIPMDLDFCLLQTGSLAFAIIIVAFTLQDGTSNYMKGLVLLLCYIVIAACFFLYKVPSNQPPLLNVEVQASTRSFSN